MKYYYSILIVLSILSCSDNQVRINLFEKKEITVPTKESGEPNLFSSSKNIYLSWIEYQDDTTDVLVFSKLENNMWSQPAKIASGTNWFVNWADFPSLVVNGSEDQWLAAHWLQKSAEGKFDYDIRIAQSIDGGKTWGPSFILHDDGIPAEHGFVSMIPINKNRIFATWLDGRKTKNLDHSENGHGHGHHGEMTLRSAFFDEDGNTYDDLELDSRICDCCQTSTAVCNGGIVIAYRDRSDEEIRDISVVRMINNQWTTPKNVYPDNWQITACPVNGPAIDAKNNLLAVAWFGMNKDQAEVKVALSEDCGENFMSPVRIDLGDPIGRVDVKFLNNDQILISWIENNEIGAGLMTGVINRSGEILHQNVLTQISLSRDSGFPRMELHNDQIFITWTELDETTRVRTASFKIK